MSFVCVLFCSSGQKHNSIRVLTEINSVARPKIYHQFGNSITDSVSVAEVTIPDTLEADVDNIENLAVDLFHPVCEGVAVILGDVVNYLFRSRFHIAAGTVLRVY